MTPEARLNELLSNPEIRMTPEARLYEMVSNPEIKEYLARTPEKAAIVKELAMSRLIKLRESMGRDAFNKWFLVNVYLVNNDHPTEGDDCLIFEDNGSESPQQLDARGIVDTKLAVAYEKCTRFVAQVCLRFMCKGRDVVVSDMECIAMLIGVFRNDCEMLWDECAKSAADLCVKKMRFGALVGKLDKKTILLNEIAEVRMQGKLLHDRIMAFETKLRPLNQIVAKYRKSRAASVVQLNHNNVGSSSVMQLDDNQTKRLQDKDRVQAPSFKTESIRVLREMMKGVKIEDEFGDSRVDQAKALTDEWALVWVEKIFNQVCYGYLVERRLIFQVLKSEIAESRRMEKQVYDRLVIHQTNQAHACGQGPVAAQQDSVVGGDINHLNERYGFVCQNFGLFAIGIAVGIVLAGLTKKW